MTTTNPALATPRAAALDRATGLRLAAMEYERCITLLRQLSPQQWSQATDCPDWNVREMAAHMLGMVEMTASFRQSRHQTKAAKQRGGDFLYALTAVQVEERRSLAPQELVDRFTKLAPRAVRARRLAPALVRRRTMPDPQRVGDDEELWTFGFLLDVILTRDPWMHRVDISRATGRQLHLTPDHDGVLVADVVAEWATRHGQPYTLHLSGPAGGSWSAGAGGPLLELDAVQFCRLLSGRDHGEGLLAVEVPF